MPAVVRMPEILAGVLEATLSNWTVAVGDQVEVGDPIAEIETEKAVIDYAAEAAGVVLELLVAPGEPVAVGTPIATIGEPGDTKGDAVSKAAAAPGTAEHGSWAAAQGSEIMQEAEVAPSRTASHAEKRSVSSAPIESSGTSGGSHGVRRFVSPLVRRLAKERGIDLSTLVGTGPGGRIVRVDLDGLSASEAAAPEARPESSISRALLPSAGSAPSPEAAQDDVPITRMRSTIAQRLTEAKQSVPHFYLSAECRVDRLWALRQELNATCDVRLSVNDFVVKAVAHALATVPEANVTWGETVIHQHRTVDIAVAVSIDDGLLTPVLRGADQLGMRDAARAIADLVERARAGKLRQHELEGGSFSISNLGMLGTREFAAIINPPHSGILAVGAVREAAVVDNGEVTVGKVMTVTLSADHRVLDGALAARWLAAFVEAIENPLRMLV